MPCNLQWSVVSYFALTRTKSDRYGLVIHVVLESAFKFPTLRIYSPILSHLFLGNRCCGGFQSHVKRRIGQAGKRAGSSTWKARASAQLLQEPLEKIRLQHSFNGTRTRSATSCKILNKTSVWMITGGRHMFHCIVSEDVLGYGLVFKLVNSVIMISRMTCTRRT